MSIKIIEHGVTEALASTVYFLSDTNFNTRGYAAVVDIGGGTSDISFWHNRKLSWEDSVKFAGGDLVDVLKDLLDDIKRNVKKAQGIEPSSYDSAMRIWPYVHSNWNGRMENFHQSSYAPKTIRTMSLFYSGICYYIGMHLRREKISEPLGHLAFAGNGIRFLEIVNQGIRLSEDTPVLRNWITLFRKMLCAGHGFSGDYNTSITFSGNPKLEVVYGLVSDRMEDFHSAEKTVRKMFGLDVEFNNIRYSSFDWSSEINAADFANANININFGNFIKFIEKYRETASNYFRDCDLNSLPMSFDKDLQDIFFNSLQKRGNQELACSLFLEALKAYIKYQYNK